MTDELHPPSEYRIKQAQRAYEELQAMNMPIEITKEITSFLSSTGTLWLLMLFGYLLARRGLDKYMKWRSKQ